MGISCLDSVSNFTVLGKHVIKIICCMELDNPIIMFPYFLAENIWFNY